MTKREMFETIAAINADNEEIVAFCQHEIELLSHKSTTKTLSKAQKANLEVMEEIKQALTDADKAVTVTDLIASSETLGGYTNQKISALLRKLVNEKVVVKTVEGKKSYFSLA